MIISRDNSGITETTEYVYNSIECGSSVKTPSTTGKHNIPEGYTSETPELKKGNRLLMCSRVLIERRDEPFIGEWTKPIVISYNP